MDNFYNLTINEMNDFINLINKIMLNTKSNRILIIKRRNGELNIKPLIIKKRKLNEK